MNQNKSYKPNENLLIGKNVNSDHLGYLATLIGDINAIFKRFQNRLNLSFLNIYLVTVRRWTSNINLEILDQTRFYFSIISIFAPKRRVSCL